MRKIALITVVAASGVFGVSTADAHLVTPSKKGDSRQAIYDKQTENLKHANYVCRRGKNATRRWHCLARRWITRERQESAQILFPPVYVAPYPWQQIATCESSLGTGKPKWHINTGNGFYGGLQFDYGTWHEAQDNLGVYWTEYAHQATPQQQVRAAMTLPLTRWPDCGAPYR